MFTFCACVLITATRKGNKGTHTHKASLCVFLSPLMIRCVSLCSHSFSMSLYFFLRMETWSLNSTGSSLIWECSRGMKPSQ